MPSAKDRERSTGGQGEVLRLGRVRPAVRRSLRWGRVEAGLRQGLLGNEAANGAAHGKLPGAGTGFGHEINDGGLRHWLLALALSALAQAGAAPLLGWRPIPQHVEVQGPGLTLAIWQRMP